MLIGRLEEIWQYPLKSAAGQKLEQATVTEAGIVGDRCWAVLDSEQDEIRTAKRWPELLNLAASLQEQPKVDGAIYGDAVPAVTVTLPSGESFSSRDEDANQRVSDFLGRPARLEPLEPPSNTAHYKIATARTEENMVTEMGLLEGEEFPDFSATPEDLMQQLAEHVTPPGTYFDAFPLHLLTTHSLQYLADKGGVDAVLPRFRANFLVAPIDPEIGLTENNWVGKRLQIGELVLAVNSRTVRCSMPSREQIPLNLTPQKNMARAMVDHVERQLGINLLVERAGHCHIGAEVHLID
jgi:uncharacterized protein